ncbi:hypothetical protein HYH02_013657 [Chlamydomonas schloesseri]|uniref:Mannose-P-dolichol utilization defect 1 protein n=1 Tax=Chlamydomonas schloesseri TaxID=2026947 RepID=A0A835SP89_9CHLO|nr:hypothetical protein HYH02_013657 [Chlamydomonas schloesseri]|eukprot:KAG2430659.1 hypothetical protein HYH02_013657 [Chlamydomonas schloesseri]
MLASPTSAAAAAAAAAACSGAFGPAASRPAPAASPRERRVASAPLLPPSLRQRQRTAPRRCVATAAAAAAGAAAGASSCAPCAQPAAAAAATAAAAAAPAAGTASAGSWMDMFAVLLGYGCLVGSCFRSVPQIAVIIKSGSAEGLSLTSNLVELLCFTITVAYNMQQGYAFNTYGEVFACWIQDVIIVGLIFKHMGLSLPVVAAATAAFGAACAWLFSPLCHIDVLAALQLSTVAVMAIGARLPQIWLNIKRGDAGVLSVATCVLNVAGCVVRVFTTVVLTGDVIILGGCVTQLILNAILLYQAAMTSRKKAAAAAVAAAASGGAGGGVGVGATGTAAAAAAAAVAATDPPAGGAGAARGGLAAAEGKGKGGLREGDDGSSSGGAGVSPVPAPA